MRRIAAVFIVLLLASYPASMARGGGEIPGGPTDSSGLLRVPWKVAEHRLANGMRALMLQDRRAPSIVFQVWYGVGSRDEPKGKTGVAHMLEHMMFRGTKKYGPKVFNNIVKRNGGSHNAFTSFDYTAYFERIASDRLGLVMELEADRMVNLVLKSKELEPERKVVMEERRSRTEDSPTGMLFERLRASSFTEHAYGNPIIGWAEDINTYSLEDLKAFYRRYYTPSNATAVIVGDFNVAEAIQLLEKHFGPIPSRPFQGRPQMTEPPQTAGRRLVVRKEAQLPYFATAHHAPNWRDEDGPALIMLESILGGGETSRLYQRLVRKDAIALEAGADYTYVSVDPMLFYLYGQPAPGKDAFDVEEAIFQEVDRLIRKGVPSEELERNLRSIEAQTIFSMDSHFYRAMQLGRAAIAGDWRLVDGYLPSLAKVTSADIVRVAKKYLRKENRTTATLIPIPPKGGRQERSGGAKRGETRK
ncbi:MAG: pitrilysin family protein [Nitrospinota bacterium]